MMAQYLSIKKRYPDAILFYRMGDFYEMFLDDAKKASSILDIALTSRNKNQDAQIPMCGVPHRAADVYIAKLIENGCKVAICEQVEDPATAKGLVRREVVRVVTPGMILQESLLDRKSNNFLISLALNDGQAGLSCLDISTGLFRVTQAPSINGKVPANLLDEAIRMDPREVLLPALFEKDPSHDYLKRHFSTLQITYLDRTAFNPSEARIRLTEKFRTRSLEGFGCDHFVAGIASAGAILTYVEETQRQDTAHINSIESYTLDSYLIIDDRSCRNLELLKNIQTGDRKGTLISVLDKTVTAMGGRLLKTWIRYPLIEETQINQRLDAVEEAMALGSLRQTARTLLKEIYDLERLGSRISMGHGNARDLTALKTSLLKLPELMGCLGQFSSPLLNGTFLEKKESVIENLAMLAALIHKAIRTDAPPVITEGRLIRDGYSQELDELLEIARDGRAWIAKTGAQEKEKTGLSSLKIKYNKVFGYFLEVSKAQAAQVPDHYMRKQTLVNAERFITEELKTVESKVMNAQDQRAKLEYALFAGIRDQCVEQTRRILSLSGFLAIVDALLSLGETADLNHYIRPEINTSKTLSLVNGRHPVVETVMTGDRYVPNSITINPDDQQILIITGPNMAGKSTVLRQVALNALMTQIGSFIPAEKASMCIIDRIFTRVGALDNLSQGQSTFMVEMEETANIVNNATENSLVILDEIGRGTSTYDGMSIAWAVAEFLHGLRGKGVKTLFATHYHELIKLEDLLPRVKNFSIAVKEFNDNIIFLRALVPGGTNRSYGIQVARLAGIPDRVITRAKEILAQIEQHGAPVSDGKKAAPSREVSQMDLFSVPNPHEQIIASLCDADISTMTPIEALNFLNELQQTIKAERLAVQ